MLTESVSATYPEAPVPDPRMKPMAAVHQTFGWAEDYGGLCALRYQMIWSTKYSRAVLVDEVVPSVTELLHAAFAMCYSEITDLQVTPNAVHMQVVVRTPHLSPAQIIYYVKGETSRIIRAQYPSIQRRLKSLWTRSYLIGTPGAFSDVEIRRYLKSQRGR